MKIKTISYQMLRVTDKYENDAVEVTVQLEDGDCVAHASRMAKDACRRALRQKLLDRPAKPAYHNEDDDYDGQQRSCRPHWTDGVCYEEGE